MRRLLVLISLGCLACGTTGSSGETATETGTDGTDSGTDTDGDIETAVITHQYPDYNLAAFEETQPCVTWSLDNDEPVYVNGVTLSNGGAYHHSNWLLVPEDSFAGEDGFWDCSDRGYSELGAVVDHNGGVLFAQSTQSRLEHQTLPDGVVIKIPPRYKVIAGVHMLNLSSADITTSLRMSLELVHPKTVNTVLSPARFSYYSLDIPAQSEARFTGSCTFDYEYETVGGRPMDMLVYWMLPHYHYLANFFRVQIIGGPRDGETVLQREGFDAGANGQTFDPPLDLTGAKGLRYTCGYNNFLDKTVGWGIGDQEMCVMLMLSDAAIIMDMYVDQGSQITGMEDGVPVSEGPCFITPVSKNTSHEPPTDEEINGPMYVPPSDGGGELPPVPECVEADNAAAPSGPTTLAEIRDTIFVPSCTYSSCHGGTTPSAGLDLRAQDLHAVLVGQASTTHQDLPLVDPGNPDGSWLYQMLAQCEPQNHTGTAVPHMPRNAPTLLDDGLVAKVREWIAAGANP